jgi:hypothetical protein
MLESNTTEDPAADSGRPGSEATELSVVDAVLWACELSEDEMEVGDLVESVLRRPGVVVRRERGPTLRPAQSWDPPAALPWKRGERSPGAPARPNRHPDATRSDAAAPRGPEGSAVTGSDTRQAAHSEGRAA